MSEQTTLTVYGERAETFKLVFGSDTVVIQSPLPVLCNLPGHGEQMCYLLDMTTISREQRLVLIGYFAAQFGLPVDEVSRDLDAKGVPIRAEGCVVSVPAHLAMALMDDFDDDDSWPEDDWGEDEYDGDDL